MSFFTSSFALLCISQWLSGYSSIPTFLLHSTFQPPPPPWLSFQVANAWQIHVVLVFFKEWSQCSEPWGCWLEFQSKRDLYYFKYKIFMGKNSIRKWGKHKRNNNDQKHFRWFNDENYPTDLNQFPVLTCKILWLWLFYLTFLTSFFLIT